MTFAADAPEPGPKPASWPEQLGLGPQLIGHFSQSDFAGTKLPEVDLRWGLLAGVQLADADLRRINLQGADLRGANLAGARLAAADLSTADLRGADLSRADLTDVDLQGADLCGACLDGADLSGACWAGARVDAALGLPADATGRVATADPTADQLAKQWLTQALATHGTEDWPLTWQRYLTALRWTEEASPALWGCGRLLASAGDVVGAATLWQHIVASDADADRARLDALLVAVAGQDWPLAQTLALQFADRRGHWLEQLAAAVQARDTAAILTLVRHHVPDSTALAQRPSLAPSREPAQAAIAEPADLQALLVQALSAGDMAAAQTVAQRLPADESAEWSVALRDLDLTEQAMVGWLRHRMADLGALDHLYWVALGPHGPTARLQWATATVYAKRHRAGSRPLAAVYWEARLCDVLAARGVPVPLALRDNAGDRAFAFAGDLLTASSALAGQPLASALWSPQQSAEAGAMLARIHLAGATEVVGPRPAFGLRNGVHLVGGPLPSQALLARAVSGPDQERWLRAQPLWQALVALLPLAVARLQHWLPLCPTGLCHGDFGGGNLLWDGTRVSGVVDWDLADVGPWVWDLARAVDLAAVDWPGRGLASVRVPSAQAILAGYQAVRPLSDPERAALPLLIALSRLDLDADLLAHSGTAATAGSLALLQRAHHRVTRAAAGVPELYWALQSGLQRPDQVLAWHDQYP